MEVTLAHVILEDSKKEEVNAAISQLQHHNLIFNQWGFSEVFEKGTAVSLLFYGVPGTGKTLMAQAIANHLNQTLVTIGTADIESSEPGGAERAIRAIFQDANDYANRARNYPGEYKAKTLLFDECDSLLTSREQVGAIIAAQINTLLQELEKFTGVVLFTTNRLGQLDEALERRITAKIEFPFPVKEQRVLIWRRMIPKRAPIATDVDFEILAEFNIAGGNIKNSVLNAARRAAYLKKKEIDLDCFVYAVEKELKAMDEFSEARRKATKWPVPTGGYGMGRAGDGKMTITRTSVDKIVTTDKRKTKVMKGGIKKDGSEMS